MFTTRRLPASQVTPLQLEEEWAGHYERMRGTMNDASRTLWSDIRNRDFITSAFDAFKVAGPTYSKTTTTKHFIALCIVLTWKAGYRLATQNQDKQGDAQSLALLTEGVLPLVEDWWDASQVSAEKWANDPVLFLNESSSYLIIVHAICDIVNQDTPSPFTAVKYRMLKSVKLQEFLFTLIILCGTRDEVSTEKATEVFLELVKPGTVLLEGVPHAITGGVTAMVRSLEQIVDAAPPDETTTSSLVLIGALLGVSQLRSSIIEHSELAVLVARKAWIHYRATAGVPAAVRRNMLLLRFSLVISTVPCTTARLDERMRILLEECDFVSLIAKCLFIVGHWSTPTGPAGEGSNSPGGWYLTPERAQRFLSLSQKLPDLCKRQPVLLRNALGRYKNYLVILDQLRSGTDEFGQSFSKIWEQLGKVAGLEESTLRTQAVTARLAAADEIIGCSWQKCVLYLQESDQIMHWCMGCKKVVYCGYFCKNRDWDEGHKDICQAGNATGSSR